MTRSLFGRWLLGFGLILLANLGLVTLLTLQQSQAALTAEYHYRLSEAAERASRNYHERGLTTANAEWAAETNGSAVNLSGVYVAVYEAGLPGASLSGGWTDNQAAGLIGDRLAQVLRGERVYWTTDAMAYTAVPLGLAEGQAGALLAGLPRQAEAGSLLRYGRVAWYTLLAVSLPTLLLAYHFIRRITRPVSRMALMADAVAQGDFTARVDYRQNDEIGALGSALNQMAEQLGNAERVRQTFLAGVSHELRTPLTTIKANTQAMLDQLINADELPEYLTSTIEEADRLRDLVSSLLQSAQPEAGSDLKRTLTDLATLVADTVRQMEVLAGQKGVRLVTELAAGCQIRVDRDRLRQVIINLLDNAIRCTPPAGEVRVTLSCRMAEATITVADSGNGIPASVRDRLFQPFVRSADSPGSGLGLYLSQRIVLAHGGKLSAEAAPDRAGTLIRIWLPRGE